MELLRLNEAQTRAFDYVYHHQDEFERKARVIRQKLGRDPSTILDIGGGNGQFMDQLLSAFPVATGYVIEIADNLLALNTPNVRKRLVRGSFDELSTLVGSNKFDLITVNWVLHHLVSSTYEASVSNAGEALRLAAEALTPDGLLYVAENEYDGFFGSYIPSKIIYAITRVSRPGFVRLASRFFNTAGVGVCFHSRHAWNTLFQGFGYDIQDHFSFDRWRHSAKRRLMFAVLFLRHQWHGHYLLRPTKVTETAVVSNIRDMTPEQSQIQVGAS